MIVVKGRFCYLATPSSQAPCDRYPTIFVMLGVRTSPMTRFIFVTGGVVSSLERNIDFRSQRNLKPETYVSMF